MAAVRMRVRCAGGSCGRDSRESQSRAGRNVAVAGADSSGVVCGFIHRVGSHRRRLVSGFLSLWRCCFEARAAAASRPKRKAGSLAASDFYGCPSAHDSIRRATQGTSRAAASIGTALNRPQPCAASAVMRANRVQAAVGRGGCRRRRVASGRRRRTRETVNVRSKMHGWPSRDRTRRCDSVMDTDERVSTMLTGPRLLVQLGTSCRTPTVRASLETEANDHGSGRGGGFARSSSGPPSTKATPVATATRTAITPASSRAGFMTAAQQVRWLVASGRRELLL